MTFTSWSGFLQALQTRFAPSQYEDPTGALFKLTQKGTVATYLSEFEDLANHIVGLSAPFLLNCSVSGLTSEICHEIQAHQPLTLSQATGLACLQEEKLQDSRPPPSFFRPRPTPPPLSVNPPRTNPPQTLLSPPLRPPPSPTLSSRPPLPPSPFKRLTSEEIASRRERDLCFSCDEKYHRGPRCAFRVFLLLVEEEDPPDPVLIETLDPDPDPNHDPTHTHDPYPARFFRKNSFNLYMITYKKIWIDLAGKKFLLFKKS